MLAALVPMNQVRNRKLGPNALIELSHQMLTSIVAVVAPAAPSSTPSSLTNCLAADAVGGAAWTWGFAKSRGRPGDIRGVTHCVALGLHKPEDRNCGTLNGRDRGGDRCLESAHGCVATRHASAGAHGARSDAGTVRRPSGCRQPRTRWKRLHGTGPARWQRR